MKNLTDHQPVITSLTINTDSAFHPSGVGKSSTSQSG